MKRTTRRKPQRSRFLLQALVIAVALQMAITLFILYDPERREALRGMFVARPTPQENKIPEPPEQKRRGSGDSERSVHSEEPSPVGAPKTGKNDVYTWTDEKGVRNFSNLPPPDHVTEPGKKYKGLSR